MGKWIGRLLCCVGSHSWYVFLAPQGIVRECRRCWHWDRVIATNKGWKVIKEPADG